MNNLDYHADPRIGSSTLKRILTSPDHFRHGIMTCAPATLALGTACHTLTLEPDSEINVPPELELRSNRRPQQRNRHHMEIQNVHDIR